MYHNICKYICTYRIIIFTSFGDFVSIVVYVCIIPVMLFEYSRANKIHILNSYNVEISNIRLHAFKFDNELHTLIPKLKRRIEYKLTFCKYVTGLNVCVYYQCIIWPLGQEELISDARNPTV